MHIFGTVNPTQISAGNIKFGSSESVRLSLGNRIIIAACKKERPANIRAYRQRKRGSALRRVFGKRGLHQTSSSAQDSLHRANRGRGVIRIKFDGAAKFLFRADPIHS